MRGSRAGGRGVARDLASAQDSRQGTHRPEGQRGHGEAEDTGDQGGREGLRGHGCLQGSHGHAGQDGDRESHHEAPSGPEGPQVESSSRSIDPHGPGSSSGGRQVHPVALGVQAAPGNPERPSGEEAVERADPPAPGAAQAQAVPGPVGDPVRAPRGPANRNLDFTIVAPFRSPLEAETARSMLAPALRSYREQINMQLSVQGSVLTVRWIEEDALVLRVSTNCFLEQLSLVKRHLDSIAPPGLRNPEGQRGADA